VCGNVTYKCIESHCCRIVRRPVLPDFPDVTAECEHPTIGETLSMDTLPTATHDPAAWTERIAVLLRAERNGVQQFLAQQEERLTQVEATLQGLFEQLEKAGEAACGVVDSDSNQDYQRRYEMALDDLRELKSSNALLQDQLSKARSTASALIRQNQIQGPCLDWETEKIRILAALESDLDENNSEQRAERIKIANVIEATDKAIAEKDKEIEKMKQQLSESSLGAGTVAEAAAALAHVPGRTTAAPAARRANAKQAAPGRGRDFDGTRKARTRTSRIGRTTTIDRESCLQVVCHAKCDGRRWATRPPTLDEPAGFDRSRSGTPQEPLISPGGGHTLR
jgi:uncharacterized coiled-coil protein SlyX